MTENIIFGTSWCWPLNRSQRAEAIAQLAQTYGLKHDPDPNVADLPKVFKWMPFCRGWLSHSKMASDRTKAAIKNFDIRASRFEIKAARCPGASTENRFSGPTFWKSSVYFSNAAHERIRYGGECIRPATFISDRAIAPLQFC